MKPVKVIDSQIKDEIRRFPTVELVRRLFPGMAIKGRSVICNPLRNDKHPSLSCFRDRYGHQLWKDHSTGESGDNIDFYMKVYPELDYVEAVDRLSFLVLGKSALRDFVPGEVVSPVDEPRRQRVTHVAPVEEPSALSIVSVLPFSVANTPEHLVKYSRERGISDEVASAYIDYVVYENLKLKGRTVMDPVSGLPVVDDSGQEKKIESRFDALGLRNAIGGYSLRVPRTDNGNGFKGGNSSFISVLPVDRTVVVTPVQFNGNGDGYVTGFAYNAAYKYLSINQTQGFVGVEPWAVRPAVVFLDSWMGRYLEGRDLKGAAAVLGMLNRPVTKDVFIVEGMFDALSVKELDRMYPRGGRYFGDVVVLNSVSNVQWAIPFLAVHQRVRSFLDNDLSSASGEKTFVKMQELINGYCQRLSLCCNVVSESGLFYPHKDINDYLREVKGFRKEVSVSKVTHSTSNMKSNQIKP